MSLKRSATRDGSSFVVPLSVICDLRDTVQQRLNAVHDVPEEADRRAAGARSALTFVRGELSGVISATRAAGKIAGPDTTVLDRAAARLVTELAEDLDDNARTLYGMADEPGRDVFDTDRLRHEARTVEARAGRLWHVLIKFMEQAGLDAEDLDAAPTRAPKQAANLKHRDPG